MHRTIITDQQRIDAVKKYLNGMSSFRSITKKYWINPFILRTYGSPVIQTAHRTFERARLSLAYQKPLLV